MTHVRGGEVGVLIKLWDGLTPGGGGGPTLAGGLSAEPTVFHTVHAWHPESRRFRGEALIKC